MSDESKYRQPRTVREAGARLITYALEAARNDEPPMHILMGIMVEAGVWVMWPPPEPPKESREYVGIA